MARSNSGTRHKIDSSKSVLRFCCTGLENAESCAECKGLVAGSPVIEHVRVDKAPDVLPSL